MMKKFISIALSIVMVIALAVNAFAVTSINLKEVETKKTEKIVLEDEITFVDTGVEDAYFIQEAGGGKFYVPLVYEDGRELKSITVTTKGCVSAQVIDFNPSTMIYDEMDVKYNVVYKGVVEDTSHEGLTYEDAEELRKSLYKSTKKFYDVVPDKYVYVIEFTVPANYTTAYTEGEFTITAVDKETKTKLTTKTIYVISDVVFFNYEDVAEAAKYKYFLEVGQEGYSDYLSEEFGYTHCTAYNASVISKTAFRNIVDKTVGVILNDNMDIEMTVVDGQNSLNFNSYYKVDTEKKTIKFGVHSNGIVAGEFKLTVDLDMTPYELAKFFGTRFTEQDVYTFYIIKNGKTYDSFTYDFGKERQTEDIVIEIKDKNTSMGEYEITMSAVAEVETTTNVKDTEEENPNTGAPILILPAIAIAVASGVSVINNKRH